MPNFVPYFSLIVLSLAVLIWIFMQTKQFHTFVIYIAFAGMIYVFEIVIVVVFAAYEYKPQITSIRYLDNMIGASVSNTITVPTIATLISVFQLRFRWILLFALMFGFIETLFVHLGVYVHHWWRSCFTVGSLLLYFSLTKWWFRQFRSGSRPIQAVSFFVYTMALVLTFMFVFLLLGIRLLEPGIFKDVYRDDTFSLSVYGAVKALMITAAIFWLKNWRWLIAAAAVIIATQSILIQSDILRIFIPMRLYALIYFACCCLVIGLCYLARRSVTT
ncbi:hypothetical protein [Cohnella panacarvi]|uniref:hypothetical protein n=1 Tax=Cohnella panacarvi TaxID=400776 RepID=UPI00047BC7D7|nr:hypothetical protein [Cohnella panacarvi]